MLQRSFALLTLCCLLPLTLAACSDKPQPDPRTQSPWVRTARVEAAVVAPRTFTGIVAARVQSDLGLRVSGKVVERLVDTGETVKRGQMLMRIDPIDLKLAAQAERDAVAAARARARQTADEEARYRVLRSSGAVSASSYDQIKAAADSARAQLNAAQAQAEVALNSTRYAGLAADADGVVMETLAEPGQVVSAGQVVVRIAHAGPREALIQLPETLRPALGSIARARLFGNQTASVAAHLRQLSQVADRQTRTFDARYVLEGDLANAPLGATITLQIPASQDGHASWQVPLGALHDAGNGPGVWLVAGEPATVRWVPVLIEQIDSEQARVSGVLETGERIVALGAHLLHQGQTVRIERQPAVVAIEGTRP
jgi:RND family efflux transporter MFP subunit